MALIFGGESGLAEVRWEGQALHPAGSLDHEGRAAPSANGDFTVSDREMDREGGQQRGMEVITEAGPWFSPSDADWEVRLITQLLRPEAELKKSAGSAKR